MSLDQLVPLIKAAISSRVSLNDQTFSSLLKLVKKTNKIVTDGTAVP